MCVHIYVRTAARALVEARSATHIARFFVTRPPRSLLRPDAILEIKVGL